MLPSNINKAFAHISPWSKCECQLGLAFSQQTNGEHYINHDLHKSLKAQWGVVWQFNCSNVRLQNFIKKMKNSTNNPNPTL